jgi:hypothetical protein
VLDYDAMMNRLVQFRVGEDGIHPTWHLQAAMNLKESIAMRAQQRAYLARYGRQDYFDQSCSLPELDEAVRAISAVVRQENELSRMTEDH